MLSKREDGVAERGDGGLGAGTEIMRKVSEYLAVTSCIPEINIFKTYSAQGGVQSGRIGG